MAFSYLQMWMALIAVCPVAFPASAHTHIYIYIYTLTRLRLIMSGLSGSDRQGGHTHNSL